MNRRDFIKMLAAVPALAWLKPEVPKVEPDVFFDIVEAESYSPSLAYVIPKIIEITGWQLAIIEPMVMVSYRDENGLGRREEGTPELIGRIMRDKPERGDLFLKNIGITIEDNGHLT